MIVKPYFTLPFILLTIFPALTAGLLKDLESYGTRENLGNVGDEMQKRSTKNKPHIFFIVVDDLGWSNIGHRATGKNGSCIPEEAVTPNMDKLVRKGILLNRHYTYNFCSPSRTSLLSGRLPVHVSLLNDEPTLYNPNDPVSGFSGIPRNMTGIASKLREAGYRTHMTGKWDAGMATQDHTPIGRGFETFFGYFHHANDYYTQKLNAGSVGILKDICYSNGQELVDLWNTDRPAFGINGTDYEEALFTENTLNIIRSHDPSEPLFLYHAFHLVHAPLEVPKEQENKFGFLSNGHRRKYAAMVNYMDTSVGKFVEEFERKGMWEKTLLVLSSDNGGPIYGVTGLISTVSGAANNMPLRGGKLSDWEGGIRVNAFLSGGFIPSEKRGTALNGYIHIADWYATLCALAGVDPTDEEAAAAGLPPIDSINALPYIQGEVSESPRNEIHISKFTLISGKYKLLTGGGVPEPFLRDLLKDYVFYDGYWAGYGLEASIYTLTRFKDCKQGCLYNIIDDPKETRELSKVEPEVLEKMMVRLKELNKDVFEPDRGSQDINACTMWQGYYGPWID